jgi:CobQ-like glutamine amidotransferase family enzyme
MTAPPDALPKSDLPPLRLCHLYASVFNVAGDGGNLMAVEQRCRWRGTSAAQVAVELGDNPDFTEFDMVFIHGGTDVNMAVVVDDLADKAQALREAADAGVVFLGVCAGLQLLGHRYIPASGRALEGVAILDIETRGAHQRFMQHAAVSVDIDGERGTVVGFENHSGLTEIGPDARPFGYMLAGAGNNGRDGTEGARRSNVFGTYLHGPILPKNPWLTDELIRLAMERRTSGSVELSPLDDTLELNAHAVAYQRALRNRGRTHAIEPARLARDTAGGDHRTG